MPQRPAPDFDYEAALKECAAGRRAALEALYRQEGPRLLGVAQRILRDRARAEDIVHDAFVNIWKQAGGFDATRGSARGWLYRILLAIGAILAFRGLVSNEELPLWLALASAVLGNGVAVINTPTKKGPDNGAS